jgi:(p)ppGpp synthase/HD superfamily hydrolase
MPGPEGTPTGRAVELTARFDSAVAYARTIHAEQVRKGTSIAYLAHLLSVAALVIKDVTTDEDLVIGALLHDAAEDCGGRPRLEDIRARFGDAVAAVVEGCTDTFEDPKPDWRPRKEAYIEHLRDANCPRRALRRRLARRQAPQRPVDPCRPARAGARDVRAVHRRS